MSHKCYISTEQERKEKLEKNKKRKHDSDDDALTPAHVIENSFAGYIFFDYETINIKGLHEPNLIIADKVCKNCMESYNIRQPSLKSPECKADCGIVSFENNDQFCYSNKKITRVSHII